MGTLKIESIGEEEFNLLVGPQRMIRATAELGFSPTSRPRSAAPVKAKTEADTFWDRFDLPPANAS
jgi:hypothetical protein